VGHVEVAVACGMWQWHVTDSCAWASSIGEVAGLAGQVSGCFWFVFACHGRRFREGSPTGGAPYW